jgi:single-strand DNA-binding protein
MLHSTDSEEAALNEIYVTINGIVGSDVQLHEGERNKRAKFRMATTERYLDRTAGEWVDRDTVWMDVVCWRRLAEHVAQSVVKGQPVIVRGRLRVNHWNSDTGPRQGLELVATSVGHDLTMGRATFVRASKVTGQSPAETAESRSELAAAEPVRDPFHEPPASDVA